MPEYNEMMDYILSEDEPVYQDDKWVLIEEVKKFQSIIEDFMQSPVTSEKKIRTIQMFADMNEFKARRHRIENYNNLLKKVENTELTERSNCSSIYREEIEKISDSKCPYWGEWTAGPCSQTCGPGLQTITRECKQNNRIVSVALCQKEFPADQKNEKEPEHCFDKTFCPWDTWEPWEDCDQSCGTGIQHRRRHCPSDSCNGSEMEQRRCNTHKCPYWGGWIDSGKCSAPCGPGKKTFKRACYYKNEKADASLCKKSWVGHPEQQKNEKKEFCRLRNCYSWSS